eukprot:1460500-Pleurochrysis_carterae.AAC.1
MSISVFRRRAAGRHLGHRAAPAPDVAAELSDANAALQRRFRCATGRQRWGFELSMNLRLA